ncbi:hypothetical protein [Cognatiyoonia sp.]|uniref:hypothetical protein n=1 Tax=Cognatiyoonia sp. TaxID=2211652 RepID=UPI003F6A2D4E
MLFDIVRDSMSNSIPATYWQLLRTSWTYIASGALRRLVWLRKGPVIAALYPVGMLLGQLLLALLLGALFSRVLEWGINLPADYFGWPVVFPWFVNWPIILAVGVYALPWFHGKDSKFYAYYLMHDYAYSARWKWANLPTLEARMAEFKETIGEAFRSVVDEVLVAGHSSSAHLGVSVLADLIREGGVPSNRPAHRCNAIDPKVAARLSERRLREFERLESQSLTRIRGALCACE